MKVESCQKSRKILDDFLPSQIYGCRYCKNCTYVITPASRDIDWKKSSEDTPTNPEVTEAHTLNSRPNFYFSRLKFFVGTRVPVGVCTR